jgi:glycosyltransferase involved in cell wall biosynthesis
MYLKKMDLNVEFRMNSAVSDNDFKKNLNLKNGFLKKFAQLYYFAKIVLRRNKAIKLDLKDNPDVLIVQREMFPKYLPVHLVKRLVKLFNHTRVIWDFDDDIFLNGEISKRESMLLAKHSNTIIGIGEYAKSLLPKEARSKFLALPTTDDAFSNENIADIMKLRHATYAKEIRVVWVGTAANLQYIDIVIDYLDQAALKLKKESKNLVFCIVCNIPYEDEKNHQNITIENIIWTREVAKNEIRRAHIGIMPLLNCQYEKGKGGFKLIQYLASGLPVISSDVGFGKEVVNDSCGYLISAEKVEEWTNKIFHLGTDENEWDQMAQGALNRYAQVFDFENNLKSWEHILRKEET